MAFAAKNSISAGGQQNSLCQVLDWSFRNLPYKITTEEIYDIFGKYGSIYQVRLYFVVNFSGSNSETRGSAYVVYDDIFDAKKACEQLSGFNVCNRYLIVTYYQPHKMFQRLEQEKVEQEVKRVKEKYGT